VQLLRIENERLVFHEETCGVIFFCLGSVPKPPTSSDVRFCTQTTTKECPGTQRNQCSLTRLSSVHGSEIPAVPFVLFEQFEGFVDIAAHHVVQEANPRTVSAQHGVSGLAAIRTFDAKVPVAPPLRRAAPRANRFQTGPPDMRDARVQHTQGVAHPSIGPQARRQTKGFSSKPLGGQTQCQVSETRMCRDFALFVVLQVLFDTLAPGAHRKHAIPGGGGPKRPCPYGFIPLSKTKRRSPKTRACTTGNKSREAHLCVSRVRNVSERPEEAETLGAFSRRGSGTIRLHTLPSGRFFRPPP
jgi:hypothetical protein